MAAVVVTLVVVVVVVVPWEKADPGGAHVIKITSWLVGGGGGGGQLTSLIGVVYTEHLLSRSLRALLLVRADQSCSLGVRCKQVQPVGLGLQI